ncbi:MAG: DUF456 domain-containing protein [Ignavibacteriaceae bacterium]
MLEIILIILGFLVAIAGIAGCIIPAIPGPLLNFVSLLILEIAIEDAFSMEFYIIWGIITILVTVLDYVLPLFGAKVYKASGYGIWGSILGMIIGTIFFPPFGMILGLLIGAVAGELIAGKKGSEAMKVGAVTFLTGLLMIVVKLAVSGVLTYYFIKRAVEYIF